MHTKTTRRRQQFKLLRRSHRDTFPYLNLGSIKLTFEAWVLASAAFAVGTGVGALWGHITGHASGLKAAGMARRAEWKEGSD